MTKPKTNYNAQEEVVNALYAFAKRHNEGTRHDTQFGQRPDGIELANVGEAMKRIMAAFGCEVERVD